MNYIAGDTHIAFISSENKVFIQSNGECVELLLDFTPQSIYRNYAGAVIILSTDNVLYFVYDGIILDTKIELKTSIVEIYFTYSYFIILDSNNVLSVYCESSKFNEYQKTQIYYYNNCSIPLNFSKELLFIGNISQLKNFDNISVVKYMQGVHCMYTNYLLTIVVFMDSTYIIYRTGFDYYSEKDITFYKNIETKFINMSIADKIKSIKKFTVCMYATYILYDDILEISTVDKNFTVFTENVMDFCPMHANLIILFQDNTVKVYEIVNNIFIEKVMDCMDFGVYSIHITTTTYFFMDADGVIHSRNISGKITKSDSKYSIKINGGSYI